MIHSVNNYTGVSDVKINSKAKENFPVSIPKQETTPVNLTGAQALSNYNKAMIKQRYGEEYYNDSEDALLRKDKNGDGEVSVEEFFSNDVIKYQIPELHQVDKEILQKYATMDGNPNVSTEEFIEYLNGPEHSEIIKEYHRIQLDKDEF